MATHAIMAYKDNSDGRYYAKFVHYGAFEDVRDDIVDSNGEEFLESIMQGASTEPFDGFYLDPMHCIEDLNWSKQTFVESLPDQLTRMFSSFDEVKKYATSKHASFIYLWDQRLIVYELWFDAWRDWFENIDCIEPFNLDNVADYDFEMIVEELCEAYDEINDLDIDVEDSLEKHKLDWPTIKRFKTKKEAMEACERYNAALPEIKKMLKERAL